jgi:S-adenosylmethionine synthetase
VAAGLAKRCLLQVAYAIGVAEPVSVMLDTYGTSELSNDDLINLIRKNFDLTPAGIIDKLNLRRPIFRRTAAYGHFGREEDGFTWEQTDMVNELKKG